MSQKVYVLDKNKNPLMPTTRFGHVRILLKQNKARVVSNKPFTIQLLYDGKHNGIPDYYVDEYLNKHLYNKCIVLQQNQGLRVL